MSAEVSIQNRLVVTLGPGLDKVELTSLFRTVFWHGDKSGTAVIMNNLTQESPVELHLITVGQEAGVYIPIEIAPIEPGQPTTPVQWYLSVRRT